MVAVHEHSVVEGPEKAITTCVVPTGMECSYAALVVVAVHVVV